MMVATSNDQNARFEGSPGGPGLVVGRRGEPAGTWIVEPSTWVRPLTPLVPSKGVRPSPVCSARRHGFQPPLAPGDRLGEYRLLERLGRGGQGDVWKALRRDPPTDLVALKVLRPSLARDPARMAQFFREAERGGRFAGPSLLPIYELATSAGYHYMAMPYVEGITLREVIHARTAHLAGKPTDEPHRLATLDDPDYLRAMGRIMIDAVEALARVHALRVAHRDIKPANILLDHRQPEGVYLCDFGLGRDLEVATPQQMRDGAGTPMYMAPERLLRSTADEILCDIYSMGVTLFEAMTLARPFLVPEYVTFSALPAFLAGSKPRRPTALRPGFPEDLEAVILRAMDRDPSRRYETANGLAADLRLAVPRDAASIGRPALRSPHFPIPRAPFPGDEE